MKRRLAHNSLGATFFLGLRVITQAILLVLMTHLLSPSLFGNFAAAASFALVLGVLPSFGAGYTMLALRAQHAEGVSLVWRYAWPMTVVLGLVLLISYVGIAGKITNPPLPTHVLLPLGVSELLLIPLAYLASSALLACDLAPASQLAQWLPLGLRVFAAIPCFAFPEPDRLEAYALYQLPATMLGSAIAVLIAHYYAQLDWRPRLISANELRHGASYAAMHLVAANPTELDKIMAARVAGAYDTGIYTTASRVLASGVIPVTGLLLAAQPRLFHHAHKPTSKGHRLIGIVMSLALGWGIICGLLLTLCSPLLPILFGSDYVKTAELMPWLAVSAPLLSLRISAGSVLAALGRPLERACFELTGIAILALAILLLAPNHGTHGLAIALGIAEASMAAIGWLLVQKRMRRISPQNDAPWIQPD